MVLTRRGPSPLAVRARSQEGAWLTNFSINLVLAAALPEMMVGLSTYPQQLGQGMRTRVLTTHLWERVYWSGVAAVMAAEATCV